MSEALRAHGSARSGAFVVVGPDRGKEIAAGQRRRSGRGADETVGVQARIKVSASHPRPAIQVSMCAGQRELGSSRRGP